MSAFARRSGLREVQSAAAQGKPLVLVHEGDASHGGGTLEYMKQECPDEMREFVFDGRHIVPWHRTFELQVPPLTHCL